MSMSLGEQACAYAALILASDNVPITAQKMVNLFEAAKVTVEPHWPDLMAGALTDVPVMSLVSNVSTSVGSASAAAAPSGSAAAPAAEAPKEEEKKKEESEESDDDMGFGLFD